MRLSKRAWRIGRLFRQVWFRAAVITLFAVLLAIAAAVVGRYIPYELKTGIGEDSVHTILEIMASSMLAVTTFSLTAMVSAYGSATQLGTPRATQLMISDSTSQNALSTFLGAFVFSIVGIIGLETSVYGRDGRAILFAGTLLVVVLVVVTLLRWIGHIAAFGRLGDVIDRVEAAAASAMRRFADDATLGGRRARPIPDDAVPVFAAETGYVTHLDVAALGRVAATSGATIHVTALPGTLVHPARALFHRVGRGEHDAALIDAFTVERHRSFDHDPRLGLIALAEIGSRALSPATNDPGTAIEVLNAMLRVLLLLPADEPRGDEEAGRPAVYVPRPSIDDLLSDAFHPLIRDGRGEAELAIRLSKTLAAVAASVPPARAAAARLAAELAAAVGDGGAPAAERERFAAIHARGWDHRKL